MNEPSRYRQGEAQTLQGVLTDFESRGYRGQFAARAGGKLHCFTCGFDFAPSDAAVETIRRLEGASDPSDMLAVLPVTCPNCNTRGTLVLGYGPESTMEDSEVLAALPATDEPPRT